MLIWIKQTLIWFNLQRDGDELSNIKDTFAESLQLQMSVLTFLSFRLLISFLNPRFVHTNFYGLLLVVAVYLYSLHNFG